eukprot:GEMP01037085.1.p1 GENE.GEMP01037085.1~~GEMP01037085.1.p1  ORF type:complete len:480 (+),score=72.19 GEMP01037085.1:57-1442(+)
MGTSRNFQTAEPTTRNESDKSSVESEMLSTTGSGNSMPSDMTVRASHPVVGSTDIFSAQPGYSASIKGLIQEWVFMSTIRKKKVPLNQYGLPDASADQLEEDTPEKVIKDQMRQAFRDMTEEQLVAGWDDGTGFRHIVDLFSQLLDLICSFVGRNHGEKFRKALDIDVLRQMVEAHVYTPAEFQNTVQVCVELLEQLESPYQHKLTRNWLSQLKYDYTSTEEFAKAICDTIMYLFRKCDLCKIEVENYYISLIPPADLENRERAAYQKIPLPLRTPWDCSTEDNFVAGLIRAIAENPDKLTEDDVPSCLALDLPTLHGFQNSLQEATLLGVMSVVLNKIFAKFSADEQKEYMDAVREAWNTRGGPDLFFDLLKTHIVEADVASAKEACAQLVKCADVADPLYKVFRARVVKFITEKNPGSDALGSKPAHLSYANNLVCDLAAACKAFADDHWQVYGSVYSK